jgi:hypothetical protein
MTATHRMIATTAPTTFRFVLGAIDPEMHVIARCLAAAGVEWEWAASPAALARLDDLVTRATDAQNCGEMEYAWAPLFAEAEAIRGTPIRSPAEAYACADRVSAGGGVHTVFVWVECRPAGASRAALEARGDVVIDHHDVRSDPMASASPADAVEASSIGQLFAWARQRSCIVCLGSGDSGAEGMGHSEDGCYECRGAARRDPLVAAMRELPAWGDADVDAAYLERHPALRPDLRIAGALDHCLYAALGGLVPGVGRDAALRAAAEQAADVEFAAKAGRPVAAASPEAFIAQVESAVKALRAAPRIAIGGMEVADLLDRRSPVTALPVAAAYAGLAYVVEAPARPGVPTTCSIGGATTPAAVRVFAEVAREAFAHAVQSNYPSLDGLAEHAEKGAARGGVYAFPERGMAGVYLPAWALAEFLRDPMEATRWSRFAR